MIKPTVHCSARQVNTGWTWTRIKRSSLLNCPDILSNTSSQLSLRDVKNIKSTRGWACFFYWTVPVGCQMCQVNAGWAWTPIKRPCWIKLPLCVIKCVHLSQARPVFLLNDRVWLNWLCLLLSTSRQLSRYIARYVRSTDTKYCQVRRINARLGVLLKLMLEVNSCVRSNSACVLSSMPSRR